MTSTSFYDLDGTLINKEIVHAVTSLDASQVGPAGYAGNGPQIMA
jgi:hypothetical protein